MKGTMKKTAAGAAMVGALGLGAAGLGSGIGQAAPGVPGPPAPPVPAPPIPGVPPVPVPPVPVPPVPVPPLPNVPVPNPPIPDLPDDLIPWDGPNVNPAWVPGMPAGQNPFGPPGQVMKMATLPLPGGGTIANPFYGVPPGQWGTAMLDPVNLKVTLPNGDLVDLIFDTAENSWGYVIDNVFNPFPIQFPAPPPPAG